MFNADLCAEYQVLCMARGGGELCPGRRKYDHAIMTRWEAGCDGLVQLLVPPQARATAQPSAQRFVTHQLQSINLSRHLHPGLVHLGHPNVIRASLASCV
jgi:hypothetical protein